MSVGLITTKADIDNAAGGIAGDVEHVLSRVQQFAAWLAAQTDPVLTAYGYSGGEIAILRSSFTDATTGLDRIRQVYQGATTIGVANDFRTFPKQLMGLQVR